jgi:hypothetical protein
MMGKFFILASRDQRCKIRIALDHGGDIGQAVIFSPKQSVNTRPRPVSLWRVSQLQVEKPGPRMAQFCAVFTRYRNGR